MTTRSELFEGPEVVGRLLSGAQGPIEAFAQAVHERRVELVLIAARGTSDHAAIYAQYVLGARNRLPVALAAPSRTSLYRTPPRLAQALVLGILQSGRSPDVVAVLADARAQGALTVALTNDPASELAAAAEYVVRLEAGPERAVAATKTYLAEIALIALLSRALAGDAGSRAELAALPAALRAALQSEAELAPLAAAYAGEERAVVLARGVQYTTARVGAEAQGARLPARGSLFRGRLPAWADRAPGARVPGPLGGHRGSRAPRDARAAEPLGGRRRAPAGLLRRSSGSRAGRGGAAPCGPRVAGAARGHRPRAALRLPPRARRGPRSRGPRHLAKVTLTR